MDENKLPEARVAAGEPSAPVLPEKPRFSASKQEIFAAVLCYGLAWIWFDIFDVFACGEAWKANYTLFSTVGGAFQILGMMVLYPLLRRKLT